MEFPVFGGSRIAPGHFELGSQRSQTLRRGLVWAVVPVLADNTASAGVWTRCGRELVKGISNAFAGGVNLRGEASGPALHSAGAAVQFHGSTLPQTAPFSCFGFIVNRAAPGGIEALIGAAGFGGWTFQIAYGSGQMGFTRWGFGDDVTTALGAVPTGGAASCVGMTYDGSTVRFFLNGRFESKASGTISGTGGPPSGNQLCANGQSGNATSDCSVHVAHVWNRVVTDAEFLVLNQDPWAIVRPAELPWALLVSAPASTRRVFVPGFIG
jgi:hypothetical protein